MLSASPRKTGYEPQLVAWPIQIKNVYQYVSPLMLACATGIADCVQTLANFGADFTHEDDNGRTCLQRAVNCQGNNQVLANWLRNNVDREHLPEGSGTGRAPEDKRRGDFSYAYRVAAGPQHKKGEQDKGRGRGYAPQQHGGKGSNGGQQQRAPPQHGGKGCKGGQKQRFRKKVSRFQW